MIEIDWKVSLKATGGRFTVPDGTEATEIARMVDEQVQRSIFSTWSPAPAKSKDQLYDGGPPVPAEPPKIQPYG